MADLFKPAPSDAGNEVKFSPEILEAKFGGYTQRAENGINSDMPSYSVSWTNAYESEANYIINFIRACKGFTPFLYIPNHETVALLFTCKDMTYAWKKGKYCDIKATFDRTPL